MSIFLEEFHKARRRLDRTLKEDKNALTMVEYHKLIIINMSTYALKQILSKKDGCMPRWFKLIEEEMVERTLLGKE